MYLVHIHNSVLFFVSCSLLAELKLKSKVRKLLASSHLWFQISGTENTLRNINKMHYVYLLYAVTNSAWEMLTASSYRSKFYFYLANQFCTSLEKH
jgi:hypothetical protein